MHFRVLVVTRGASEVAAALYPFWDNDADDGRQPHFVFVDDTFDPPYGAPDPETGRFGWWANPMGKWDGWTLRPLWTKGPVPPGAGADDTQCHAAVLQALIRQAPERMPLGYALLVHGAWSEREERPLEAWRAEVRRTLESLNPEDWVSMVDCHH